MIEVLTESERKDYYSNNPDFAWAVGLFEGEGSVIHRRWERPNGGILTNRGFSLGSTDLDVLQRFHSVVIVGSIGSKPEQVKTNKPMWRWYVQRWVDTEPLARAMLPLLGIRRRAKVEELLADPPSKYLGRALAPEQMLLRYGVTAK